ncbi:hypothetical protein Tco_0180594 [Tanacetum coccineum]
MIEDFSSIFKSKRTETYTPLTFETGLQSENEFGEEFSDITRVAEMADGNPAKEFSDIIKTYDFETFIQKLLHQASQSSHETSKTKKGMKSHLRYGSNLSLLYPVLAVRNWNSRSPQLVLMWGYEFAQDTRIKSSSLAIIT